MTVHNMYSMRAMIHKHQRGDQTNGARHMQAAVRMLIDVMHREFCIAGKLHGQMSSLT